MAERITYTLLGLLLGLAAYVVAGALWLANFAWQNNPGWLPW